MANASITFKDTDANNQVVETLIDNINSDASPTQIANFVQGMDDLTPNSYSSVKVTKQDTVIGEKTATSISCSYHPVYWESEYFNKNEVLAGAIPINLIDNLYFVTNSDATPSVIASSVYDYMHFINITADARSQANGVLNDLADLQEQYPDGNFPAGTDARYKDTDFIAMYRAMADENNSVWRIDDYNNISKIADEGNTYYLFFPATDNFSAASVKFTILPNREL